MQKTCSQCCQTKPLTEFYRKRSQNDGRGSACMMCTKIANHESYQRNKHNRKPNPEVIAKYRSTIRYKTTTIWNCMKGRVKRLKGYSHVKIRMTREEFVAWATPALKKWIKKNPGEWASIDRIDPKGHYEIENIRILSHRENSLRPRREGNSKNVGRPKGKAWCSWCKKFLPEEEFPKRARSHHGLYEYCKSCCSKRYR